MAANDPSLPIDRGTTPAPGRSNPSSSVSKLTAPVTIALVIAALYLGRSVLIPLALAVLFSFALAPVAALLERWHLGRAPAVLIVILATFALVGALAWTVSGQLIQIAGNLPAYEANIQKKVASIQGPKHGRLAKAIAAVGELKRELTGAHRASHPVPRSGAAPVPVQVVKPSTSSLSELRQFIGPVLGPLGTAGIVIVFTIFILLKREDLRNRVIRFAGRERVGLMTTAFDDGARRLSRYLLLQAIVNSGYGIIVGSALYLIGVPHAVLWGVLTAVLRFIPYVGILIAAALPIAMALAVFPGWSQAIMTVCLFAVLEGTVASFIEPMLYGSHTGISSLAIIVAAVFWTMLWGPVGLILSTPMTVCVIVLGRHVPQLRFLEIALGDEPALSPEAHFYQRLLAMDEDEVHEIADEYLKEKPVGSFYENVIIPALRMAEQDRHGNALDQERHAFICQAMKELIEELGDRASTEMPVSGEPGFASCPASLLCVPARDDADEIVAMIVAQLASFEISDARFVRIGPVAAMVTQVADQKPGVVCISALPPGALGHARSLSKRLRMRIPEIKIVLGLWKFEGGIARAQERAGDPARELVGTTLAEAMLHVRQLTGSTEAAAGQPAPPAKGRQASPMF
ncbi:MAG: AI-2E family transporter [Terriglobia bacterium]